MWDDLLEQWWLQIELIKLHKNKTLLQEFQLNSNKLYAPTYYIQTLNYTTFSTVTTATTTTSTEAKAITKAIKAKLSGNI